MPRVNSQRLHQARAGDEVCRRLILLVLYTSDDQRITSVPPPRVVFAYPDDDTGEALATANDDQALWSQALRPGERLEVRLCTYSDFDLLGTSASKLSPHMIRALRLAVPDGLTPVRGGYWVTPSSAPAGYKTKTSPGASRQQVVIGEQPVPYVGTSTVYALLERGLLRQLGVDGAQHRRPVALTNKGLTALEGERR